MKNNIDGLQVIKNKRNTATHWFPVSMLIKLIKHRFTATAEVHADPFFLEKKMLVKLVIRGQYVNLRFHSLTSGLNENNRQSKKLR